MHRRAITLLLAAFLTSPPAHAARHQQSSFSLEFPMNHPVPIPAEVLDQLRAESDVQNDAHFCSAKSAFETDPDPPPPTDAKPLPIPADWFSASEITLSPTEPPALIVKAENACLGGANTGPFWVFRHTHTGYHLEVHESALWLHILPKSSHGFRIIELSAALQAGRYIAYATYAMRGHHYQRTATHTTRPN